MSKLSISNMGYKIQELLERNDGEPIIITRRDIPIMVLVQWEEYVAFKQWQNAQEQ